MTTQSAFFHALLRPSILQILRATGYHSARPSVVDSLTDIAARYLTALCLSTASHAIHNHGDAGDYTVVDVRMALQDVGALQPQRTRSGVSSLEGEDEEEQEDGRVVEEFVGWFAGQRMRELMDMGVGDGEIEATDYLSALKKKHSKTAEDSKYTGTVIGKPLDTITEIQVEGGPVTSIDEWSQQQRELLRSANAAQQKHLNGNGYGAPGNGQERETSSSPAPSSGLSSVGSRLGEDDDEMDLS
ncbi:hypothetical protein E4U43_006795 [Claviceps pusilla]|uniref:Bromodomain associated domain-containing protein n=1 Tax=Claviceps pusilla TaxID=123648 RepID=A0A9P7SVE3_9HYPO|nr:hypothetical protein E4U43_006795 [Claviceps pusilla]